MKKEAAVVFYVVVSKYATDPEADEPIWTISRDPDDPGWETDCGCRGYGLLKADAEFLARCANAAIAQGAIPP